MKKNDEQFLKTINEMMEDSGFEFAMAVKVGNKAGYSFVGDGQVIASLMDGLSQEFFTLIKGDK